MAEAKLPLWVHILALGLIIAAVVVIGQLVDWPTPVEGGVGGGLGAVWVIYGASAARRLMNKHG